MSKTGINLQDLRLVVGGKLRLKIQQAEFDSEMPTMILGPNGAGKSLLLRVLHGLTLPQGGRISFPANLGQQHHQAMVFQRPVLLRRSVTENVAFALRARGTDRHQARDIARHWLERAGLGDLGEAPARRLSGGEQQRLAMVRALACDPKLIFLDEPCANLDPRASVQIEHLIKAAIKAGVKVVMVTHDQAQARRLGGEFILMHQGQIVAQATHEQFFRPTWHPLVDAFLAGEPLLAQAQGQMA
ncbi:MAG: ATP-binding cassette domain-containing protein [Marinovum sp.]|nr:ATP-binding cassette domain-containing protein [Marinovum sp.]